jgi:hypothetical protein
VNAQFADFQFHRKLDKVGTENYYSVPLSPAIIANMQNPLDDLRIYNIDGKDTIEVPFLLEYHGDETIETPVKFELINDVTRLKCCSYITLKMPKKMVINMINLKVLENNFDKILSVEGSNDNKEWFTIASHLRITGFENSNSSFRSTSVRFPSSEFVYFRIKFDDDSSPKITVTDANAFENKTIKGNYDEIAIVKSSQVENKKEKTSELILELKGNNRLSYILLKSNAKNDFYRNINIYKSNGSYQTPKGPEEAWQIINSGVVISNTSNELSLQNEHSSKLKIEIINHDNQPISFDEIKLYSEKIEMKAKLPASENLFLVYGSKSIAAPVYDLVHFQEKIPQSLSVINSGKEEIQAAVLVGKANEPFIQNKKWLWLIMGSLIILIGYFAFSMLKKENSEDNV